MRHTVANSIGNAALRFDLLDAYDANSIVLKLFYSNFTLIEQKEQ